MSNVPSGGGVIRRWARTLRQILFTTSVEEINYTMDDEKRNPTGNDESVESTDFTRSSADGGDNPNTIEAGKRSPRWYERIENVTSENRDRSVQNQQLLERVDMRTVWIARLLIGLLVTVIGGVILQTLV